MSDKLKTILVLGKDGQVGFELIRTLAPLGRVVAAGREDFDLTDERAVRDFVRDLKPSLIANAAAYTNVDSAEDEPDFTRAVNATAPGILAEEASRLGAPIMHFSTDYVFDGKKGEPYTEDDEPGPLSVYGETKLKGEEAVAESGAMHVILRLSWIYSLRGTNFLLTMLRLAKEHKQLRVVDDQIGAPCWARMAAEASAHVAGRLLGGLDWFDGVYHLPAGGRASWFEFAREIFRSCDGREDAGRVELTPVSTSERETRAKRPAYSVLSGDKIRATFGIELPGWKEQLAMVMEEFEGR